MGNNLYIVVGSPLSDIGKGWLAGSIASTLPYAHILKIDPLLNPVDLISNDLTKGLGRMTDAETYDQLGIQFTAEQLLLHGNILLEFLEQNKTSDINVHNTPRLTFGDAAEYFAQKICDSFTQSGKTDLVVEVGGAVIDTELSYIPSALRLAAFELGLTIKIVVLSYLDYSEDPNLAQPVKTRHITFAIEHVRRTYGEPFLVFFRRRNLPSSTESMAEEFMGTISRRAAFPPQKLVYLPNFASPLEEREFVYELKKFD
jgi:CTP synthase (UTP-ammonia lyase)